MPVCSTVQPNTYYQKQALSRKHVIQPKMTIKGNRARMMIVAERIAPVVITMGLM